MNGALLFTPPPLKVKKHFKKTGKVIFLTLVWALLILSIIKLCILPEGEMSRTEFVKTLWYHLVHGILIYVTKPRVAEIPALCNATCYVAYVVIILFLSLFIVLTAKRIPFICRLFKL